MSSAPSPLTVVLDTNVIISALLSAGPPREIMDLALRGVLQACASPFILEEVQSVLEKKIKWPRSTAHRFVQWLQDHLTVVHPKITVCLIERKRSDNRILECALEARADYLVTGDQRDLLPLKSYQGTEIVRPIDLLNLLDLD